MNDLKLIKDKYGEKMMHLCRTLFPTLLETPGLLYNLLSSHFDFNKFLYDDIENNFMQEEFKDYIYSFIDVERGRIHTPKSPEELLKEAGYKLYECKSERDIQYFKKYYSPDEQLCTFHGGRLNRCFVFFAVKENVDKIIRSDFKNPRREDEYGTSVISIQFTRTRPNTLSIKNRYNHTVNNPDATFQNNLDNIIPGLTESFEKKYNLKINRRNESDFELPNYVMAKDGKFYKYNYEINNVYYCPNNIIIDNFEVIKDYQEKEKSLIIDYFIVDLVNKKIKIYDESLNDSFVDCFRNIIRIDIDKNKESGNKTLNIVTSDYGTIKIEIDKTNKIISYSNEEVKEIGNNFMHKNKSLRKMHTPKLKSTGNSFLGSNESLQELVMLELEEVGDDFCFNNKTIQKFIAPKLIRAEDNFMYSNTNMEIINFESLEYAGVNFFAQNKLAESINLPELRVVLENFLFFNKCIKRAYFPKLISAGGGFMYSNEFLEVFYAPMLEDAEYDFLGNNVVIERLILSNLRNVMEGFLGSNNVVDEVDMPNAKYLEDQIPYHIYELATSDRKER